MIKYLYKRDNKSKVRVISLILSHHNSVDGEFYTISGESGVIGGKMVPRPIYNIWKGKVKRTLAEQADLEFTSLINSYRDKGYKTSDQLDILDVTDLDEIEAKVPAENLDQKGAKKPMLAKHYKDVANFDWDKTWLASKKYDGVRCNIYKNTDSKIVTSSRGGKNYDIAASHILNDPCVQEIFKQYPDIILDGELYIHGKPLNYISGLCRLEELDNRHQELEFHCYDIVDESKTFLDRLEIIKSLPIHTQSRIKRVLHISVSGKDEIMKQHNLAIQDGYEGLILRDPLKNYKCGSRDRMFKVKEFQDDEFTILGIVDGLRDEDMCFLMETKEGYVFKAKPVGDRDLKQQYKENVNDLIGKKGTVKFFGYTQTDKPVPNLPVFIQVRNDGE